MKMFMACLGTETNTFSNMPTGMQTFAETMLFRGDASTKDDGAFSAPLKVWRRNVEQRQGQVVESLAAFAQPAGVTVRAVYEGLRDEILADLARAKPVDLVLLNLHGAMVADGYDDCEGDLVERVRTLVGPGVTVGVELDLHCSITEKLLANADAVITYKEYPHIDPPERAQELFDICLAKQRGECRPVMAVHDLRMVSMWRTPVEPASSIVRRMQALEGTDGILSVSLAHGFPWGDVPEASAKVIVIADGDPRRAQAVADEMGREIWAQREATHPSGLGIDAALDAAAAADRGPVVLADMGDNAGVGAPSDSTYILERVLQRGDRSVLSGLYWDPVAVRFCLEAGEGASLDLRVGGKVGVHSGAPIDVKVRVMRIVRDAHQTFAGGRAGMGDSVWLRALRHPELDLVINSLRTQTFHPDAFTQFGIDLGAKQVVVVKSTQHFYAGFAPVAAQVLYVAGPGAMNMRFETLDYRKFSDPYWPRVAAPQ